MSGDPGYILSVVVGLPNHPHLLGQIDDCGSCGRLLRRIIPRFMGGYPGVPAVPHHFNVLVDAVVEVLELFSAVYAHTIQNRQSVPIGADD